ncbi:MAG: helix-turn-helix domain-containing protein [Lachnospiraceae bacterium]|nr:helix-turn-helix domain-containing protein [Lachnospiraceae bacterium]
MKCKLTLPEKLKDLRVEHGLSLEQLAEATKISRSALGTYETDEKREIGGENLRTLAEYYHVSADYLLGIKDTKKAADADLSALKLDDDTVTLFKNGHFNHRLLCEIIKHPAFEKYMADIEIYVNGIVTSQIHTLNSLVDFARQQVMENCHPNEDEFAQRELNACYVDEYKFFRNVIQSDLGEIIKDLRKTHAGETETAPTTSIVEDIKSDLETYKNFKGSRSEKDFALMCKRWGINYSKVPDDEKMVVMRFLRRSKNFKG